MGNGANALRGHADSVAMLSYLVVSRQADSALEMRVCCTTPLCKRQLWFAVFSRSAHEISSNDALSTFLQSAFAHSQSCRWMQNGLLALQALYLLCVGRACLKSATFTEDREAGAVCGIQHLARLICMKQRIS